MNKGGGTGAGGVSDGHPGENPSTQPAAANSDADQGLNDVTTMALTATGGAGAAALVAGGLWWWRRRRGHEALAGTVYGSSPKSDSGTDPTLPM